MATYYFSKVLIRGRQCTKWQTVLLQKAKLCEFFWDSVWGPKIACWVKYRCSFMESTGSTQVHCISRTPATVVDVVTFCHQSPWDLEKWFARELENIAKAELSVVGSPESTIHDSPLTSADKSGLCGSGDLQRVLMEISKQEFDRVNYPCNYCRYKCNPPFLFVHPRCIDNISLRQGLSDYVRASTLCCFSEEGIQTGWRQRSLKMPL